MDAPVISNLIPSSTIRKSNFVAGQPYIEQVRLSSPVQTRVLPAISMHAPSRLRDALSAILIAGANEVDFILARSPGVLPWEFDSPNIMEMFIPYFNETQGALVVYPDAGGPWPRDFFHASENIYERMSRLRRVVQMHSMYWQENYQLALIDAIIPEKSEIARYFSSLYGHDLSLCTWEGPFDGLRRHGWRPACAFLGGYIVARSDKMLTQSLIGHKIILGAGRKVIESRAPILGGPKVPDRISALEDSCVVLKMVHSNHYAEIQSEGTLRRPIYEWAIPVVRTVKAIHQSLMRAAELFVFRPVNKIEAMALQTAVEMVLTPFYRMGIIVGPDGEEKPLITSDALPDYEEPMLSIDLAAQVRPWCQHISLRVMVKSGIQPLIVEED
jgi:hypothetical protein